MREKTKQDEKALIDGVGGTLANWPPSRGPEPERPEPTYTWPVPLIEGPSDYDSGFEEAYELDFREPPEDDGHAFGRDLDKKMEAGESISMQSFDEARDAIRYLSIQTSAHVSDLLKVEPAIVDRLVIGFDDHAKQLVSFLPERSIKTRLSYPLGKVAVVTVEPYTIHRTFERKGKTIHRDQQWMTIGWYLWALAKAYESIYESWEKWGIWGHAIGDLVFEQVVIKDGQAWIGVGS